MLGQQAVAALALPRRVLGSAAAMQLADERRRKQGRDEPQPDGSEDDEYRLLPPFRINHILRLRDGEKERQTVEFAEDEDPPDAVDGRCELEGPALGLGMALEQPAATEIAADRLLDIGRAHHQRLVVVEQRHRAIRAEIDAVEKLPEISEIDGAGDHAAEASIRPRDAAAQRDRPILGNAALERAADIEAETGMVAMDLEILLIAEIGAFGHELA